MMKPTSYICSGSRA